MADDLVAELTLRLRNEMQGQIDEIRGEFTGLDETLQELRDVLGDLTAELAALRAPVALAEGMQGFVDETADAIAAVQGIGTAIDEDIAKIGYLKDAMADIAAMPVGAGGAGGGGRDGGVDFIPAGGGGGGGDDDNQPGPHDEPLSPGRSGGHGGDVMSHLLMAGVEVGVAKESADDYAAFNQILYQTAIKQGYTSDNAGGQVEFLNSALDHLALQTGNSSEELAKAYYYLTIHGMDRNLINSMMTPLAQDATAYGNEPLEDAQSIATLNQVLGIAPDQMLQALSIISKASTLGGFGVGDFGNYLQGLGSQLSLLKDTGIGGLVQVSAAVESTHKNFTDSAEDAIDIGDLITYLASPTAARFFDRTKRSQDLMGANILDLFKKYHIDGIDIPKYLDNKEATGEGSFDAMMDLARLIETELPKNVSGSDEREIFGALFHNAQAAHAAMAIAQNYDVFKQNEDALYGVKPGGVQTDFQTSINSPQGQLNITNEEFAEMNRELGQNLLPSLVLAGSALNIFATGLNTVGGWYQTYFAQPVGTAIGTAAANLLDGHNKFTPEAYAARGHAPLEINLNIKTDGSVVQAPGGTPAPGVSVKVNQGQVLGAH